MPLDSRQSRRTVLLVVGNSHANCLASAVRSERYVPASSSFEVDLAAIGSAAFPGGLVLETGGSSSHAVINPVVTAAAQRYAKSDDTDLVLLSVVGGNHFSRLGLFETDGSFDIEMPDDLDDREPASETLVPYDAVLQTYRELLASTRRFLELALQEPFARVLHLEAPPPVYDNDFMERKLPQKTRELAHELTGSDDFRLNPPEIRRKLWQCQSHAMREICADLGVHYRLPPPEIYGADGWRIRSTWADAAHASGEYGAMVLRMFENEFTEGSSDD
jgi:hypothetical protein